MTKIATHTEAQAAATLALATYLAKGHEAELVETADYFTITVDGTEIATSYPFAITADELAAMEAQRDELHVALVSLRTEEETLWNSTRTLSDSDPQAPVLGERWFAVRTEIARAQKRHAEITRTLDNQTFSRALRA